MPRLVRFIITILRPIPILLLLLPLFWSGCGYVHLGRLPKAATDTALLEENANLRVEKKILQQELALARKEGDTLRTAMESRGGQAAEAELTAKLAASTRELASLRGAYAELQAQRATIAQSAGARRGEQDPLPGKLAETEEKLAQALRDHTRLQQENSQLRKEIDRSRAENTQLMADVAKLRTDNTDVRSALAQLNTELLAQKEARNQAEQNATALRTQLRSVMRSEEAGGKVSSLGSLRESTASSAREMDSVGLSIAGLLPAGTVPTAILQTRPPGRDATTADSARGKTPARNDAARAPTQTVIHTVKSGETLEILALRYYGRKDRWQPIYVANNKLLRDDKPLRPGMELIIPPIESAP